MPQMLGSSPPQKEATRPTSRSIPERKRLPNRAANPRSERTLMGSLIRRGDGWWSGRFPGSSSDAACALAGPRRPKTGWPSFSLPAPTSCSIWRFSDRVLRNPLWGIFSWLGGLDISREQYERRISFSFGENARILEAEVVEENPQGIGAEAIVYHVPPDTLTLKPMLFTQGESIRLRVVVDNPYLESCRSVAYGGS